MEFKNCPIITLWVLENTNYVYSIKVNIKFSDGWDIFNSGRNHDIPFCYRVCLTEEEFLMKFPQLEIYQEYKRCTTIGSCEENRCFARGFFNIPFPLKYS
jgi:hypothetical protein